MRAVPYFHRAECFFQGRLITVRIAKEARAFKTFESFQYAIEQVISVCRQNEGWLRATREKAT